ncbi:hypothetical protein AYL99_00686 [Fonsecaea erecta]|uniref:Uncharacterized protein n=1 Tax=Fonsecaea erecta TaxID=1367422 RepID=A0A178ZY19_9EURO|nr:hypothetical protein AYL99_00686 [Fonsecaea erecta]OAP64714.1 hypothetical protein AYL99_00686 [Fonsecaea erecta]
MAQPPTGDSLSQQPSLPSFRSFLAAANNSMHFDQPRRAEAACYYAEFGLSDVDIFNSQIHELQPEARPSSPSKGVGRFHGYDL